MQIDLAVAASRARGSLLGGAIGDALGAPVEFASLTEITRQVGPAGVRRFLPSSYGDAAAIGLVTDDTQMTLFTLEGVINALVREAERGLGFTPAVLHHSYIKWLRTQTHKSASAEDDGWLAQQAWLYSRRSPGNTCLQALSVWDGFHFGAAAVNNSKGCGGVMRSAPIGFLALRWGRESEARIFEIACEAAGYTHGHPTGQIASGALAMLIAKLMLGEELEPAVVATWQYVQNLPDGEETARAIRAAIGGLVLEERPDRERLESLGGGWVAEEALSIGIHCALAYPEPSQFLDALSMAATHSGDSDSTAAICGNILGAFHGAEALPPQLAYQIEGRATILEMADDFVYEITAGNSSWAGDLLVSRAGSDSWQPMGSAASEPLHSQAWMRRYPGA